MGWPISDGIRRGSKKLAVASNQNNRSKSKTMMKNSWSLIVGFLALVFKTSRVLVFVLFLGFIVASHTITALTSTAISAVAGTASTVMGRSKANVNDLTAQNKRLRTDLDVEHRRHL